MEEQQKKAALEAEAGAVAPVAATPPAISTPAPAAASSAAATGNQTLPEYARGLNNYVMPSTPATPTQSNREGILKTKLFILLIFLFSYF